MHTPSAPKRDLGRNAKVLLGIVILLSFTSNVKLDNRWTMVEYFAGKGHTSAAFRESLEHQAASFEINDSRSMDFMSPSGFALLS